MTTPALDRAIARLNALHETRPDVVRLAQTASLAVRIEPPLLRRLRLACVPTADVGTEADLWFSRLVESRGVDAIVLESNVVQVLREHLADDRPLFGLARRVTIAAHRNAPAALRLEEAVNTLALMRSDRAAAAIDRLLRPAVRALRESDQRALEIARWWLRAAPRLHAGVWQAENALALLVGAAARLGRPLDRGLAALPAQSLDRLSWVLPAAARTRKLPIGVELDDRRVQFVEPRVPHPTITVPATTPAMVEVRWRVGDEYRRAVSEAVAGTTVDLDAGARDVTLHTLDEAVYDIRQEATNMTDKTCFVIMGFGKKTDFATGRTLDLDKTYRNIIKPAAKNAGLECLRADEIAHAGVIDVPMYEQIMTAHVVIADLSTANRNALYELGVRHALRPYHTIVICEDGDKYFPFDANHVLVHRYHHMGEGIEFDEVERFRATLTQVLVDKSGQDPPETDSPVYQFLSQLDPPVLRGSPRTELPTTSRVAAPVVDAGYAELMKEVDEAQQHGDFVTAKALLSRLRKKMSEAAGRAAAGARERGQDVPMPPEDPYIVQRLALVTYKSAHPSPLTALEEARALLKTLNPETSNDTETLGLWGAVHKRLWQLNSDASDLDAAVRAYERGFYLRHDYYNGINLAFLFNARASRAEDLTEAIADFVNAQRIRRQVLALIAQFLASQAASLRPEDHFWALAARAEALRGLDDPTADEALRDATNLTPAPARWMIDSAREQLSKLDEVLRRSPLPLVSPEAQRQWAGARAS